MRKLLPILVSLSTAVGAVGAYVHFAQPQWLHSEQGDDDGGPPNGDDWIIRNTYPTGRFDPTWAADAAVEERAMTAAIPAGVKTYNKALVPDSPLTLEPGRFVALGPMPENNTQNAYGSVSGRANVIAIDPVDPTIAYMGSDGGGIWKTTTCCSLTAPPNNTTSWQVVTDVPEVAGLSISDITIDPHNHNTIYAGTGDLNYGSFSFGAVGVLKSSDQGQSWRVLGTDKFSPYYLGIAGGFPQYQAIGKVVVDPNNSNTVIVGTKTSVYFSYDAGENWVGPCYTNPYWTGAAPQRQDVTGLVPVSNGDGTTRLYVAIGTRGSVTPVQSDLDRNGSNGVYRLDAIPGGGCPATNNWTLLNNGWLPSTGTGAPQLDFGRIELAVSPDQPSTMYAALQSLQTSPSTKYQVLGVWRSDDAGNTWVQKAVNNGTTSGTTNNIRGCESSSYGGGGQMWYDARLTVQPGNPEITWLTGYDLYRSTDGGSTYTDVTCGWGTKPAGTLDHVHVDQHALNFFPGNPDKMLIGTDGGVFYTENATSTSPLPSFRQLNNTINSIEFYFGDITSNFANSANPAIGAGAQDNGCSAVKFNGTPTGPVQWNSNCSGDGTTTKIEPINNAVWFNSSQYGSLARSLTYGNPNPLSGSFSTASGNTGGTWGGTGDLSASIFAMSYDIYKWGTLDAPGSGCSTASGCNHMIAGTNRLWETVDMTNPTAATMRASWKARTPNLTKNNLILGTDNRSYINYVAYSFTDPTVAAVGTNDGNVQIVFGLGTAGTANCPAAPPATDPTCANAVNVTDNNNVLPNRPIFGVRFDPNSALVAYAAVGGFNQNTPGRPGHVFQVTCSAYNCPSFAWKDKTGNLPNIPVEQIMPNPNLPKQVFAGTDWGLYYTDDITVDSPVWNYFDGFPRSMVWELVVDRGFTTLAAFTRSRGAWVWPLPNAAIGSGADLAVTMTGSSSAGTGGQATYAVTVINNGPNAAMNVVINDPVPAGVTVVSVSGDCTAFPCTFASLSSGVSRTATVTYAVPDGYAGSTLVNTANVSSTTSDPVSTNNNASVTTTITKAADLALGMTGPTSTGTGGTVTYTISVTNNGPSPAQTVSVTDATPAGLTFVSNVGDCAAAFPCAFASIAPGTSRTIVATYAVPSGYSGSTIVNTASVSSATTDPVPANNSASVTTTVAQSADLAVAMQAPGSSALRGGTVTYTIAVTNNGLGTASGVSIADATPAGLVFVSNSGDCVSAFPCTFASLASGSMKIINATFSVPANYAGANPIVNSATVTATTTDPVPGNNSASASIAVTDSTDLSIAQNGTAALLAGGNVSYTVTIANAGPSNATGVSVTDPTPAGLSLVSVSGDCTALPCTLGALAAGANRNYVVTFAVPANYSGTNPIANVASVTSTTNDPNLNNNVYVAHTTVGTGADLAVVIDAPAVVVPGGRFDYAVTVTNNGPSVASGVLVNSVLPAGVDFVGNAGDCTSAWPCTFPGLAVGETRTITTTVCVPANYAGSNPLRVSTDASSGTPDAYLGNNSAASNVLLHADVLFRDGFESGACQ